MFLHMARSICRRAERSVVPLTRDGLVDVQVGESDGPDCTSQSANLADIHN